MVQWLRLAPNAGSPDQGTRSHMLQLRVCMPQLKIPHATMKTQCNEINKYFLETGVFDYVKFQKFMAIGTIEK